MSVVLDSREMAAVNFHHEKSGNSSSSSNSREMKRKVDDVMMRGISCFLGSGFHEKMSSTGSCRTSSPGRHAEDDLFCDYHHQRSDDAFGNIPMVALSREYNLIRGDHATAAAAEQAGFSRVLNAESDSNSVSSSIGAASSSSSSSSSSSEQQQHLQEEDGEEVQSERKSTALLPDFGSLEESLPLKRGLSNCFGGKSKSFGCLSDAVSLKDLVKSENPYNKRRRILLAYKNGFGRAGRGFHSTINLTINSVSMSVVEEEDEEEEDQHEKQLRKEEEESSSSDDGSDACIISPPILHQYHHHHHHHPCSSCCSYSQINRGGGRKLKKKFTSPRSFSSLTDLRT